MRMILTAVTVALSLSACGQDGFNPEFKVDGARPQTVKLDDGRSVICVWEMHGNAGGLSCDWEHAK